MKIIYTAIFSFLFLIISQNSFAQTSPLNFTILSDEIILNQEEIDIKSSITKTDNTITWTQMFQGKSTITNFDILSVIDDNWDNTNSSGSITLSIQAATGDLNTFRLYGDENEVSLKINPINKNTSFGELSFKVISIVYL